MRETNKSPFLDVVRTEYVDDVRLLDGRHPCSQREHDIRPNDLLVVVQRLLRHVELRDLCEQREGGVVGEDSAVHEIRLGPEEGRRRTRGPRRLPNELRGLVGRGFPLF